MHKIRYELDTIDWEEEEAKYERARNKIRVGKTEPMALELIVQRSAELNNKNFSSERSFLKLWESVTSDRLERNRPLLNRFFGDFVCLKRNIVIEVDGKSHEGRYAYDCLLDQLITASGLRVLRLTVKTRGTWLSKIQDIVNGRFVTFSRPRRKLSRKAKKRIQKEKRKARRIAARQASKRGKPIIYKKLSELNEKTFRHYSKRPKPIIKPDLDEIMERALSPPLHP